MKQLTVFIENRLGRLEEITDILSKNNINIICISLADTTEYGMLRMIVSQPAAAYDALSAAGLSSVLTDVIAVAGEDKPGSIAKIVSVLAQAGMSLDYAYAYFAKSQERAIMIIKVEDRAAAKKVLKDNGIPLVNEEEIAKLLCR
jgi:hypothetical protein